MEDAKEVVAKHRRHGFEQLKRVVRKFLENNIDRRQLQEATDQIDASEIKFPTVAITTLSVEDVQRSLQLELDVEDAEMQGVQPLPLPPHLMSTLGLIEKAIGNSKINEASARWVVDAVILHAYEAATTDIKNAQPLSVQCERTYQFGPVILNRKKVILSGRPDYSVWYGESEALCLNVLILKAKGPPKATNPIAQLLGYMGCIHRARKSEGKRNCGVYGMASTGETWTFLKISNDSKWTEHPVAGRHGHLEKPFGLLVWTLKRAAALSTSHSKETSAGTDDKVGLCPMDLESAE
ncbi:uncharacterized protein N7511_007304 [Penicillium nucicola]|uniref:uncharacterized protein n=1 Tax=Penicillium nucicola TaxID=1850975 RepID=UPI0025458F33|nr:uncharacterized protein N7511_007304 [Penicillium nucicola]KAJ5757122.1 hypothetical protein N7511_007304 [Penicillium nucicola]